MKNGEKTTTQENIQKNISKTKIKNGRGANIKKRKTLKITHGENASLRNTASTSYEPQGVASAV